MGAVVGRAVEGANVRQISSSLLSLQSLTPSHTEELEMQSPLLHLKSNVEHSSSGTAIAEKDNIYTQLCHWATAC